MSWCFQVDECKQQMLARIADQKADCEMVRDTSISKLPGIWENFSCLLEAHVCVHSFVLVPTTLRLLNMRSYIDTTVAHLAVWQQGRQTKQACGQSALCPDALQILRM